jgi:hypothetical protein
MRMPPEEHILSPATLRLLTSGFEITDVEVREDATQVTNWSAPRDELLVHIEKRYAWPAKTAARYLRNLLLAIGQTPQDRAGT